MVLGLRSLPDHVVGQVLPLQLFAQLLHLGVLADGDVGTGRRGAGVLPLLYAEMLPLAVPTLRHLLGAPGL